MMVPKLCPMIMPMLPNQLAGGTSALLARAATGEDAYVNIGPQPCFARDVAGARGGSGGAFDARVAEVARVRDAIVAGDHDGLKAALPSGTGDPQVLLELLRAAVEQTDERLNGPDIMRAAFGAFVESCSTLHTDRSAWEKGARVLLGAPELAPLFWEIMDTAFRRFYYDAPSRVDPDCLLSSFVREFRHPLFVLDGQMSGKLTDALIHHLVGNEHSGLWVWLNSPQVAQHAFVDAVRKKGETGAIDEAKVQQLLECLRP